MYAFGSGKGTRRIFIGGVFHVHDYVRVQALRVQALDGEDTTSNINIVLQGRWPNWIQCARVLYCRSNVGSPLPSPMYAKDDG